MKNIKGQTYSGPDVRMRFTAKISNVWAQTKKYQYSWNSELTLLFSSQKWEEPSYFFIMRCSSSCVLVCYLMADCAFVCSKLIVVNRASQFWKWLLWWWPLNSGLHSWCFLTDSNIKSEMRSFKSNENILKKEGGSYYVVSKTVFALKSSAPLLIRQRHSARSCEICSHDSGGMLKSFREAFRVSL